jgi:hypothetical protein
LNKTLTDIFLQIEREIVDVGTKIWLNGRNWTIYMSKMYKSPWPDKYYYYQSDSKHNIMVIKAEFGRKNDMFRYNIEPDIPMNSIQRADTNTITSISIPIRK